MSSNYNRVFNFSAGPANLPVSVLEKVRDDLVNYKNSGASVMEMSHRSKEFDDIIARAETSFKELLGLSDDYSVLFLQGGASLQFSMVPMNLFQGNDSPIDVIHSGYWSEMAIGQLKKGFSHRVITSSESDKFKRLPNMTNLELNAKASYAYICTNNTIEGTQFHRMPKTGNVPLVADMSSDFLSRPFAMKDFGLVFAGAQKNLGPSGVCVVIIRKDLAERAAESLPTMLQYRTHIKAGSRYNTPPAFGIYVCGLVLDWIKENGGLAGIEKMNQTKAKVLYDAIDQSTIYKSPLLNSEDRSLMNVVFRIKPESKESEQLEETFIKEAKKAGLVELKGHRAIGGLRASIYNAHPIEGVKALANFMKDFEKRNG